jgi:hypothetical protein
MILSAEERISILLQTPNSEAWQNGTAIFLVNYDECADYGFVRNQEYVGIDKRYCTQTKRRRLAPFRKDFYMIWNPITERYAAVEGARIRGI